MNRRSAIVLLAAIPFAAWSQPIVKTHRIAVLSIGTDPANPFRWRPFFEALGKLGYEEGRNLRVDRFFGDGNLERLPGHAAQIAAAKVDVVVTTGDREVAALRNAGVTAPIVFTFVSDPIGRGFVSSLARPGGNITGFSSLMVGLSQKYVDLLREILPDAKQFVVLASTANTRPSVMREYDAAGRALGITVTSVNVSGPDTYAEALARSRSAGAVGLIVPMDGETFRHRKALVELALKHRLPGIYGDEGYVEAGGLISYSSSFPDRLLRAAGYVDRILRGAKPGELPVEQPVAFDLAVNLRTARALGLTIPHSLLLRATRMIE